MIRVLLQFHAADYDRAMLVARLIADLEVKFNPNVELTFVPRFDCPPPDDETLKACAKKMPLALFRTSTKWYGWPAGCNAMALDCMMEAKRLVRDGPWKSDDMLLLIEADCCPLTPSWLGCLRNEWTVARAAGKIIMGSWRNSGGQWGHINGNCCLIPGFADMIPVKHLIGEDCAWDAALAPYIKDLWHVTGLIKNCFQTQHISDTMIETPELGVDLPVMIHGIKSMDAISYTRSKI